MLRYLKMYWIYWYGPTGPWALKANIHCLGFSKPSWLVLPARAVRMLLWSGFPQCGFQASWPCASCWLGVCEASSELWAWGPAGTGRPGESLARGSRLGGWAPLGSHLVSPHLISFRYVLRPTLGSVACPFGEITSIVKLCGWGAYVGVF